jgi:Ca2+-binding RTX toxin-like protein
VSAAGDVNGDGVGDLLVGARGADPADPGGRFEAGQSYVVFGRDQTGFPAEFELSSLLPANGGNGSDGFVLNGIASSDFSGSSVSAAGDVNGDGIGDLLVGANSADPDGRGGAGESYVVFGRDQTAFPAVFELSSLAAGNGSAGFVLNGIDAGDRSAISVSAAGDVNGDGVDDLIVGARYGDPGGRNSAGESYVVFGRDQTAFPSEFELSSLLPANGGNGSAGFVLNGIDANDQSGISVSAAGDVNDDGVDDVLVRALHAFESYVVFGRGQIAFPPELELSSLLPVNGGNGSSGFVLNGSNSSVSAAGDVNGDGVDDLMVGESGAGKTFVVFGRDQMAFSPVFELSSLQTSNGGNGSAGFVLREIDLDDNAGAAVSAAGDVNHDGVDDLLVGAPLADAPESASGESYVIFGRLAGSGGPLCEGTTPTITGTAANDDIRGTSGPDVINALAGNDIIRGLGGDDIVCGGQGNDTIYGNAGNDTLFGQAGNDTLVGGGGIELLSGGAGDDVLRGGGANDQLFGDEGNDTLAGGAGNDSHDGGDGTDRCNGGAGNADTAVSCEQRSNIP